MKTKTITIIIFLFTNVLLINSQTWQNTYNFPSNYDITQMQFLNPNTGWVSIQSGTNVKILKTIDKGINWNEVSSYNIYISSGKTFFVFTDESNGFRAYTIYD